MVETIINCSTGKNLGTKLNLQNLQKTWQSQEKDGQNFE